MIFSSTKMIVVLFALVFMSTQTMRCEAATNETHTPHDQKEDDHKVHHVFSSNHHHVLPRIINKLTHRDNNHIAFPHTRWGKWILFYGIGFIVFIVGIFIRLASTQKRRQGNGSQVFTASQLDRCGLGKREVHDCFKDDDDDGGEGTGGVIAVVSGEDTDGVHARSSVNFVAEGSSDADDDDANKTSPLLRE